MNPELGPSPEESAHMPFARAAHDPHEDLAEVEERIRIAEAELAALPAWSFFERKKRANEINTLIEEKKRFAGRVENFEERTLH